MARFEPHSANIILPTVSVQTNSNKARHITLILFHFFLFTYSSIVAGFHNQHKMSNTRYVVFNTVRLIETISPTKSSEISDLFISAPLISHGTKNFSHSKSASVSLLIAETTSRTTQKISIIYDYYYTNIMNLFMILYTNNTLWFNTTKTNGHKIIPTYPSY